MGNCYVSNRSNVGQQDKFQFWTLTSNRPENRTHKKARPLAQSYIWCWTKGDCTVGLAAYIGFQVASPIRTINCGKVRAYCTSSSKFLLAWIQKLRAKFWYLRNEMTLNKNNNRFEIYRIDLWNGGEGSLPNRNTFLRIDSAHAPVTEAIKNIHLQNQTADCANQQMNSLDWFIAVLRDAFFAF